MTPPSTKSDGVRADYVFSIANWLCLLFGIFCFAIGAVRLWESDLQGASLGLGAGLLLVFAATIDRFELLKGLGIEAKTRKLRETIEDADKAVERLRPIAELALRGLMQLNATSGRFGKPTSPAEAYRQATEVKRILKELGSSDADIRVAMEPWARYACVDVAFSILRPYDQGILEIQQARQRIVDGFYQPIQAADQAFVDAVAAVREVGAYRGSILEQVSTWRLDEFPDRLREVVDGAPSFTKPAPFDALQAAVAKWTPEMQELARDLDFRVPDMWFDQIRKAQGE